MVPIAPGSHLPRRGAFRPVRARVALEPPGSDRTLCRACPRRAGQEPASSNILIDVWQLASGVWDRAGRAAVAEACGAWNARLGTGASIEELMPPRHPLTRADRLGFDDLFEHRNEFALSPLYFCLSGG